MTTDAVLHAATCGCAEAPDVCEQIRKDNDHRQEVAYATPTQNREETGK